MKINVGYIVKRNKETIREALDANDIHFEGPEIDTTIKTAFDTVRAYREDGEGAKVFKVILTVKEVKARTRK